jgi:hypothetical protein
MDNATNEWDNEMNDLLAMAREQLEILHGEIFDRNVEHKVIDKCDTLIDILLKKLKVRERIWMRSLMLRNHGRYISQTP